MPLFYIIRRYLRGTKDLRGNIMNRSELMEIKKRFKIDKNTFSKVAGCCVNEENEKVCTFVKDFKSLTEEETYLYLDIANKALSGKIENNLINISFSQEELENDGNQKLLLGVIENHGRDADVLDILYDRIISACQYSYKYLIMVLYDGYDVMKKTSDNMKLDESEVSYDYIICAICPIELTKNTLSYQEKTQDVGLSIRNWIINMPEAAFLYPSFNDRCPDIHEALFYVRSAKAPDKIIAQRFFGMENPPKTITEQKKVFEDTVKLVLSDEEDETVSGVISEMKYNMSLLVKKDEEINGKEEPLHMTKALLGDIVSDIGLSPEKEKALEESITPVIEEKDLLVTDMYNAASVKAGEIRAEKREMSQMISEKNEEIAELKGEIKDSSVVVHLGKYAQCHRETINGKEYLMIPVEENDLKVVRVEEK